MIPQQPAPTPRPGFDYIRKYESGLDLILEGLNRSLSNTNQAD